jgi:hypothetical protein
MLCSIDSMRRCAVIGMRVLKSAACLAAATRNGQFKKSCQNQNIGANSGD